MPQRKVYVTGSVTSPAPVLHTYVAGLNGARLTVYAGSLYAAKQAAVQTWKPLKKDAGLLWVELHQLSGSPSPVQHVAA